MLQWLILSGIVAHSKPEGWFILPGQVAQKEAEDSVIFSISRLASDSSYSVKPMGCSFRKASISAMRLFSSSHLILLSCTFCFTGAILKNSGNILQGIVWMIMN